MTLPKDVAKQTQALALTQEAANRPTALVAVAGAVLAVCIVVLVWSTLQYTGARRGLSAASGGATGVYERLARIEALLAKDRDEAELFPRQPFFQTDLTELVRETLGASDPEQGRRVEVRNPVQRTLTQNQRITSTDITVLTVGVEPSEMFRMLDTIERSSELYRSVIMSVRIGSDPSRWTGEFTCRMYEAAR